MNINKPQIITEQYLVFPEDNEFTFLLETSACWQNIPSDIKYRPIKEISIGIEFDGKGGGLETANFSNIIVSYNTLGDEIVQWCQEQIKTSQCL